MIKITTARGRCLPLGATAVPDGVNFAVLSRNGTAVWLVLYALNSDELLAEVQLDPSKNRTGGHWHILIGGLPPTFRYGWRVDGPPGIGHRFNPALILLDPSATAISDGSVWGQESAGKARHSLFYRRPFNWHEDVPPRTPLADTIIYELHVRGFTCHPTSAVAKPGTFAGLAAKIPYLKSLGVTAVELLPIHEFDEHDCPFSNPVTGESLRNFWGYGSIAFAAPKAAYASVGAEHGQVNEFREMVRAFHQAGIEVILDVVFNHTGEGDDRGHTYSFRGLDNDLYYLLDAKGAYLNYTGCGNTLNCNHPIVRGLLMDCLRYWVADMHVDGLRFDLASIMGRDRHGNVLLEPPVIESISEDGVLTDTKLIAEPWDAAGLYQVGHFPYGGRWSEWNGRYRDDVRAFWRGDIGKAGALATRICGSSDLYEASGRRPLHSINFLTCHDGFTLWDLVSYDHKHNEANGEANRDGLDDNVSWNSGIEGPTDDPAILALRERRAKSLIATLLISQGVPMLLAGDEFLRSQQGNNNAWCQDNEIGWIDWRMAEKHAGFLRFIREMIGLRRQHSALRRESFFHGTGEEGDLEPDITWHGQEPDLPAFTELGQTLAFTLDGSQTGREPDRDLYVACNATHEEQVFCVPRSPSGQIWHRVVDTALASPEDILPSTLGSTGAAYDGPVVGVNSGYALQAFAMVILIT
jgi:glycogen operon protein